MTARLGDDVLTDKLDPTSAKARQSFADQVAKRWRALLTPDDQDDLSKELDRIGADVAAEKTFTACTAIDADDLDVSRIVRPERFITPEVSGLAVPHLRPIGGKVTGSWRLMLQWADGRREVRDWQPTIDLPDGGRLYLNPEPMPPTPEGMRTLNGWSAPSRQAWLEGADPPNPADLFARVAEKVAYFLYWPEDQAPGHAATLALWVILTYTYSAWDAVPYLYLGGPQGSGKSRVLDLLARLAFRPLASSSMSAAACFRTLHSQGGTLLLDEAERLKQANDPGQGELLSMLLAGYKRGGQATRLEPVGDSFKHTLFDVYGPKALACIAGLPPALASRCITLMMFRAAKGSPKSRLRIDEDPAGWQTLRDDLHTLALSHGPTWRELVNRASVCPKMSGRDFELWQPLLALADWIEGHGAAGLLKLMQDHAQRCIDENRQDATPETDETLLRALADRLRAGDTPTAGEVLRGAVEAEPEAFRHWSAKGAANALKRYGVLTRKSHGRLIFPPETIEQLRKVESSYGLDLGVNDAE